MKKVKSFNEFKKELETNSTMQDQFKADPVGAVQNISQSGPLTTDSWIYRITVISLGATIVFLIIGIIILLGLGVITSDANVPTILTAVGSAAIGALAGLLKPPSPQPQED
jgi:hypothetical protein